ncbi:MAG: TatA/E family twin arginine-targeting protein translocase [Prochlorococcaceae cyanobacterium]
MNIFGIGLPEMAVIAGIALLVFGPKRLPEMGRSLGRTLKGFQTASTEFEQEFRSALSTPEASTAAQPAAVPPAAMPVTPALSEGSEAPPADPATADGSPPTA